MRCLLDPTPRRFGCGFVQGRMKLGERIMRVRDPTSSAQVLRVLDLNDGLAQGLGPARSMSLSAARGVLVAVTSVRAPSCAICAAPTEPSTDPVAS